MDTNDKCQELRRELYQKTREDLLARSLSNSEKFDAAILTLSMASLGVSLTLIRDGMNLEKAHCLYCLVASWWFFGLAIISTMFSFVASQLAIKKQLDYAQKYYLENNEEYLNKKSCYHKCTDWLNCLSGILFVLAIILTIKFVSVNLRGI